jgi:serine/threonine protein kinase
LKNTGLTEDKVKRMSWQILGALSYLHGHGIVHRGTLHPKRQGTSSLRPFLDRKPENILLYTWCIVPTRHLSGSYVDQLRFRVRLLCRPWVVWLR